MAASGCHGFLFRIFVLDELEHAVVSNPLHQSHKKRKGRLETRTVWTWNIWGGRTENVSKSFCEELLSENEFEAVFASFCCYDYDAKVSEAVQKIATDKNVYHKCSWCIIICWIAKIYQSITVKKSWLLGNLRHS